MRASAGREFGALCSQWPWRVGGEGGERGLLPSAWAGKRCPTSSPMVLGSMGDPRPLALPLKHLFGIKQTRRWGVGDSLLVYTHGCIFPVIHLTNVS